MKTLFEMLSEIYNKLNSVNYDNLSDYEKGLKDILNLLDCRMSGNKEYDMYFDIMSFLESQHKGENQDE